MKKWRSPAPGDTVSDLYIWDGNHVPLGEWIIENRTYALAPLLLEIFSYDFFQMRTSYEKKNKTKSAVIP